MLLAPSRWRGYGEEEADCVPEVRFFDIVEALRASGGGASCPPPSRLQ